MPNPAGRPPRSAVQISNAYAGASLESSRENVGRTPVGKLGSAQNAPKPLRPLFLLFPDPREREPGVHPPAAQPRVAP
jgi:hypothetical protein